MKPNLKSQISSSKQIRISNFEFRVSKLFGAWFLMLGILVASCHAATNNGPFALSVSTNGSLLISTNFHGSRITLATNTPVYVGTNPVVTANQLGSIAGLNNSTPAGGAIGGVFSNLYLLGGIVGMSNVSPSLQVAISNGASAVSANATNVWVAGSPTNYTAAATNLCAHLTGIDSALGQAASAVQRNGDTMTGDLNSTRLTTTEYAFPNHYHAAMGTNWFGGVFLGMEDIALGASVGMRMLKDPGSYGSSALEIGPFYTALSLLGGSFLRLSALPDTGQEIFSMGYIKGFSGGTPHTAITAYGDGAIEAQGAHYWSGKFVGDGSALTNIAGDFITLSDFQDTLTNYLKLVSAPTGVLATAASPNLSAMSSIGGTQMLWRVGTDNKWHNWAAKDVSP